MKRDELHAANYIHSYLLRACGLEFELECGPNPPDFWLTLDGARIALEITRLADEKVDAREAELAALRQFSEDLERELGGGILDHVEVWIVSRGRIHKRRELLKKTKRKIEESIAAVDSPNSDLREVVEDCVHSLTISIRPHDPRSSSRKVHCSKLWNRTVDNANDVEHIVDRRFEAKERKLAEINGPKYLGLHHESFILADEPNLRTLVASRAAKSDFFARVFLVHIDGKMKTLVTEVSW